MIRQRVNILYVHGMKWKGQKAKEVEDTSFKLWYTGTTTTKNEVGIMIDKSLKDGLVDIKQQEDKIILVKLLVGDLVINVISPNESIKRKFWEELDTLLSSLPTSKKLFIGGYLTRIQIRVSVSGVYGYGNTTFCKTI
jgi:hypothetical protein